MLLKGFVLRFLRSRTLSVFTITAVFTLVVLYCYVQQPRFLRMLDYKVYDALLYASPKPEISTVPVIVDLDEASLETYGQWPWPRFILATLISRLEQAGVAAVGLDILLSEKDRSSPAKIRSDLKQFMDVEIGFDGLPDELYDYDILLAKTLRMSTVLGIYCNFAKQEALILEQREMANKLTNTVDANTVVAGRVAVADATTAKNAGIKNSETDPALKNSTGANTPATNIAPNIAAKTSAPARSPEALRPIVQKTPDALPYDLFLHKTGFATQPLAELTTVAPVGMINMNADLDGVVRRLPLIGMYDGKLYATLGLRTLMAALKQKTVFLRTGADGLQSLKVGQYVVPLAPDGSMTLPFKGPAKTFPYYSVKDIIEGKVGANELKGRIAFVGTSAPGLLDIRVTPLERVYPGVEAHATLLDAILSNRHLQVPPWTPGVQSICIIIAGLISGLSFGFAKPKIYAPLALLLLGGTLYASYYLFCQGIVFSPLYVLLTITALGAVLPVQRFILEEKQKKVLRSAFSRYVAPEVVERITRLEGDIFAGEERELSIMFTDIRGFTSISEKLSPQQIVLLLNRYFTPMTALVRGNKGTLDKFIGDALMAFWNAPVSVPDHAHLAVLTALQMQETLKKLNVMLQQEFGIEIRMGVGVHTGKAYVGNMGSEELLNYTLIGDNVNLASRLEGLCSQFGVTIVVSAETKELCHMESGELAFLPLDTLRVKGKQLPVSTYTVLRPTELAENSEEFTLYIEAHDAYAKGEFSLANQQFTTLLSMQPSKKLYALYLDRCKTLLQNPPEIWDGVWTLTSK